MRHDHRRAPLEERPQGLVQHALELVEKGMLRRCEGHLDDGRPWPRWLWFVGREVPRWHHRVAITLGWGGAARHGPVVLALPLADWGRDSKEAPPSRQVVRRFCEPGRGLWPLVREQAPVSRGKLPGALATLLRATVAAARSGWRRRPHRALSSCCPEPCLRGSEVESHPTWVRFNEA